MAEISVHALIRHQNQRRRNTPGEKGDSGGAVFYWDGSSSAVEVVGTYVGQREVGGALGTVGIMSSYENIESDFGTIAVFGGPLGPF